jgi:hypothetical protein
MNLFGTTEFRRSAAGRGLVASSVAETVRVTTKRDGCRQPEAYDVGRAEFVRWARTGARCTSPL